MQKMLGSTMNERVSIGGNKTINNTIKQMNMSKDKFVGKNILENTDTKFNPINLNKSNEKLNIMSKRDSSGHQQTRDETRYNNISYPNEISKGSGENYKFQSSIDDNVLKDSNHDEYENRFNNTNDRKSLKKSRSSNNMNLFAMQDDFKDAVDEE